MLAEHIRAAIERDEVVFAISDDGFAQVSFRTWLISGTPVALLEELYVAPEARGEGQGRALLELAMELASERGAISIELNTSVSDVAARSLYESAGFTNLEDGSPMLFYERDLQ